jgi:hypothetical protein
MIKKLFFFLLLSIVSVSCFSQQDTVTLPNGQKLIPKNPNNYPSAVYNDSLKVIAHNAVVNGKRVNLQLRAGDIKDAAVNAATAATASAIASKASTTDLGNLNTQLRSDLATKSALIDSIKSFVVAFHYAGFTPNTPISVDYSGMKNGWHAIHFSNTAYGVTYDANSQATVPVVSSYYDATTNTYTNAGFSTTSIRDNNILMAKVENGAMVAWYTISPNSRLAVEVAALKTLMGSKASAADLSAEAAARVAGDALKMDKTSIDTSKLLLINTPNYKTAYSFSTFLSETDSFAIRTNSYQNFVNSTKYYRSYVTNLANANIIGNVRMNFPQTRTYFNVDQSLLSTPHGSITRGFRYSGNTTTKTMLNGFGVVTTSVGDSSFFQENKFYNNPIGLFQYLRNNIDGSTRWKTKGLYIANTITDSAFIGSGFSPFPEIINGSLYTDSLGNAYVRKNGNWDLITAASQIKSKTLTLATSGTTNTLDLENAVSIDITLTGTINADTYIVNFSNAREGARVSISFEQSLGTQGDNSIVFNSNFIRNDKTAMGTYLIGTKMLDFVVKGGKLRATNL